jgi:hypothetical protein
MTLGYPFGRGRMREEGWSVGVRTSIEVMIVNLRKIKLAIVKVALSKIYVLFQQTVSAVCSILISEICR